MPGNSFGQLFRITTFGESHGAAIGVVIDGCPPGLSLHEEDLQIELNRRRPGQSSLVSSRDESDSVTIVSGVFEGQTTGTPLTLILANRDARSKDYEALKDVYRPSHADYTYEMKHGFRDWRGGGRASARETAARVAAGAVAQKFLKNRLNIDVISFVESIRNIKAELDLLTINKEMVDKNPVRCPNPDIALKMADLIEDARSKGDSVGGTILGVIKNVPTGLGEPVFDKLHADLGKAMLSINAARAFEIGEGFGATHMYGSEHNDSFNQGRNGQVTTETNRHGGVLGGISSGQPIIFRVGFKPPSTLTKAQATVTRKGEKTEMQATGRHDPCVLPRAVPIVDAMAALVIMDHFLRHKAQNL